MWLEQLAPRQLRAVFTKVREREAASAVTALRNFIRVLKLEAFALVSSGLFDTTARRVAWEPVRKPRDQLGGEDILSRY
jgi:hypothetical protein